MTQYLVNPSKVTWSVADEHYAVELAAQHREGWRFATEDEVRKMYERDGLEVPPEFQPKVAQVKVAEPPPAIDEATAEAAGRKAAEDGDDRRAPYDGRSTAARAWYRSYDAVKRTEE